MHEKKNRQKKWQLKHPSLPSLFLLSLKRRFGSAELRSQSVFSSESSTCIISWWLLWQCMLHSTTGGYQKIKNTPGKMKPTSIISYSLQPLFINLISLSLSFPSSVCVCVCVYVCVCVLNSCHDNTIIRCVYIMLIFE